MRHIVVIFLILTSVIVSFAQSKIPILEKRISIEFLDEKLPDALARIAREGKFSFSYNSSIISPSQTVSLKFTDKSIREILNEIFKGSIEYKERGNHLILSRVTSKPQPTDTYVTVSGYVENINTKERISDVSVYDKKSIASAVTDNYGFFRIKLDKKLASASLTVSKKEFRDTLISVPLNGTQIIIIPITPLSKDSVNMSVTAASDSIKENLQMPYEDDPNIQNISDTLYSDIQISFLPFLGSNGRLSGNTINNYSINILGGYSLGTRQIELGFIANLDRGDVSFLQIAGIGNLVGRNVYGVQASGMFNVNGGETKAAQLTGGANVNFKDFQGVQAAGFANTNLASADGVQIAGFANMSKAPSKGIQIAGFGNLQLSQLNGTQIAGVSNISLKRISGSQISGVFNYGSKVNGTQIGLFNYADTLNGVPIGLISLVKTGYHKLEISSDEVFYTNVAFRTGVRKFYNIIFAGIKPEKTVNSTNVWTFGYGIGSARRLSHRLQLNIDLTSQHVNKGDFTSELSLLNKFNLGIDWQFARKLSLYGGATLNGYVTNSSYQDYPTLFTEFSPSVFTDKTYNDGTNLKMWFGAKVGLRFF